MNRVVASLALVSALGGSASAQTFSQATSEPLIIAGESQHFISRLTRHFSSLPLGRSSNATERNSASSGMSDRESARNWW